MTDIDPDDSYRSEIARRNQRRALNERDYKLMIVAFGILAYSAFANLVVGALQLVEGAGLSVVAIYSLILSAVYAIAAHQVWFKKYPAWWLIVLPAMLTIIILVLTRTFSPIALLLNAVLLITIPL